MCVVELKEKVRLKHGSTQRRLNGSEQALREDRQQHVLRDGLQSVCKRGTAHPSWAVCGCQTSGVHSRDGGKVAGLAGRGLEFETPLLTFMQAGHNNLVSRCLISLHHEADDEDMPIGRAASVKHTYKGQQDRTQWRHEVMTGLRHRLKSGIKNPPSRSSHTVAYPAHLVHALKVYKPCYKACNRGRPCTDE